MLNICKCNAYIPDAANFHLVVYFTERTFSVGGELRLPRHIQTLQLQTEFYHFQMTWKRSFSRS